VFCAHLSIVIGLTHVSISSSQIPTSHPNWKRSFTLLTLLTSEVNVHFLFSYKTLEILYQVLVPFKSVVKFSSVRISFFVQITTFLNVGRYKLKSGKKEKKKRRWWISWANIHFYNSSTILACKHLFCKTIQAWERHSGCLLTADQRCHIVGLHS